MSQPTPTPPVPSLPAGLAQALAAVAETTINPVLITDADDRIEWVNPGFVQVTGWSLDEIRGCHPRNLLTRAGDPNSVLPAQGHAQASEVRLYRRDGTPYWALVAVRPIEGTGGLRHLHVQTDVTARRAAERAALANAQWLQMASALFGLGLWQTELPSGRTEWDPTLRRMFGIAADEPLPSYDEIVDRFVLPEDRARLRALRWAVPPPDEHIEVEYRIRRHDGEIRHILSRRCAVERDAFGEPTRMLGAALDVTEQRQITRQLRGALRRLRLAAEASGIGAWERDLVTGEGYWDPTMFTLLGLRLAERAPTREQTLALVHPDDRPGVLAAWQRMQEEHAPIEYEYRIVRNDGSVVNIVTRAVVERDAAGTPLRAIGTAIDVTEIRRTIAERDALTERIRIASEAVGLGIWEYDPHTRQSIWNDQMYALFGHTRESFRDLLWSDAVHPEDRARTAAIFADAVERGKPFDSQFRVLLPDGSVRWLASRGQADVDARGRVRRVRGVNWDITERMLAESALRAKETAERASQAKTEFLSRMSHELRTPLNAILGFTQLLEMDPAHPLAPAQRERLRHIGQAGWHLLTLINEILDLSRIEAGAARIEIGPVPLAEVVDESVRLVAGELEQRRLALTVSAQPDAPVAVLADRTRLKQVLLNLLSNAVKYNREGGRVTVTLGAAADSRGVIAVRDTGRGIPSDKMDALFQPFNRLGLESAPIEGTGIGLVIALRLVEQMGGTLEASSEPGVGSEFRLTLRSAGALVARAAAPAPDTPAARTDVQGSVLCVDGDAASRDLVRQILRLRPGVSVFMAGDADSARVLAAVCQPDLLLLDLCLPEVGGAALLAQLRADPATTRIPCVGLTRGATPQEIGRAQAAGMAGFLAPPIDARTLLDCVDRHLGARR